MRETAEKVSQKASAFETELSLNRGVYDALSGAGPRRRGRRDTKYYVQRTLRDFRLAGVDKDEATRKRIQELRDELVPIGQDFDRNIREDLRTITAASASELEGLPRGLHRPPQAGRERRDHADHRISRFAARCSRTRRTRTCASGCSWSTTTARTRRTWKCSTG